MTSSPKVNLADLGGPREESASEDIYGDLSLQERTERALLCVKDALKGHKSWIHEQNMDQRRIHGILQSKPYIWLRRLLISCHMFLILPESQQDIPYAPLVIAAEVCITLFYIIDVCLILYTIYPQDIFKLAPNLDRNMHCQLNRFQLM